MNEGKEREREKGEERERENERGREKKRVDNQFGSNATKN